MFTKFHSLLQVLRAFSFLVRLALPGLFVLLVACSENNGTTVSNEVPTSTSTVAAQTDNTDDSYGSSGNNTTPVATATPAAAGTSQAVTLTGADAFSPEVLTVSVGTTVVWTNNSASSHTVTSDDGTSFNSGTENALGTGETFSFTFTKPGNYTYHCEFHAFMKGTIVVQ